jgi:hypothetical protein
VKSELADNAFRDGDLFGTGAVAGQDAGRGRRVSVFSDCLVQNAERSRVVGAVHVPVAAGFGGRDTVPVDTGMCGRDNRVERSFCGALGTSDFAPPRPIAYLTASIVAACVASSSVAYGIVVVVVVATVELVVLGGTGGATG